MSTIYCPNCGNQISDKTTSYCPNCGYCLNKENTAQTKDIKKTRFDFKSKKIIIAIIVAVIAIFGIVQFNKQNTIENYGNNLEKVTSSMLDGASQAETCGNLIREVWYNAIYEERDSQTDPFTRPNGYFVSDFNDALQNLFADESFNEQINSLKDNQTAVQDLMKEMKNPPEKYEETYEVLSELYNSYFNLTNLAINPSGSLQTFSANFNEIDTEFINRYNEVMIYLD